MLEIIMSNDDLKALVKAEFDKYYERQEILYKDARCSDCGNKIRVKVAIIFRKSKCAKDFRFTAPNSCKGKFFLPKHDINSRKK